MPSFSLARTMLAVLKEERQRLGARPTIPELEYDAWEWDNSTIGEMCLTLLVAVRHELDRNLIWLAARSADDATPIGQDEYYEAARELSRPGRDFYPKLEQRLSLATIPAWRGKIGTLQLLTNCFKHDPFGQPDKKLRENLRLRAKNYAPLAESPGVVEALNRALGVGDSGDWTEITARFIDVSEGFLAEIHRSVQLRPVSMKPVGFLPGDFAH